MTAYLIADIEVHDPVRYDAYRRQVKETIERYGGKFLVAGGPVEILEGDGVVHRPVVVEFPTMAALERWYHSPEYAPLIALRQAAARGFLYTVTGVHADA
ncbi:MAG: DUF1330 domain-containing protein [Burkholderiales bacterium]|nr:DUF1330 domain-containing protein [Burkholderiales bacterium]